MKTTSLRIFALLLFVFSTTNVHSVVLPRHASVLCARNTVCVNTPSGAEYVLRGRAGMYKNPNYGGG
ncbi:2383_t:CDS:2 [Ambispora gerdemannii]|uniref:2383_t:CDS:1 n=1 Tax=Ambispora gerdemannii TaxID=144530 RepID=A0A9N8VTE9_9GLOM|nr:2383_t:CDS:2 [Ambispora gerdemannii]